MRIFKGIISTLLLIFVCLTGFTGFIADRLDLHRFLPHKILAISTLSFAGIHLYLNRRALWSFWTGKEKKREKTFLRGNISKNIIGWGARIGWVFVGAIIIIFYLGLSSKNILNLNNQMDSKEKLQYPEEYFILNPVIKERPPDFKEYKNARVIDLSNKIKTIDLNINDALLRRRSIRDFVNKEVSIEDVATLIRYIDGITDTVYSYSGRKIYLRTAPSAGALYGVDTYIIAWRINNLENGIYYVDYRGPYLIELATGDFSGELVSSALDQEFIKDASFAVVLTVYPARMEFKYRERSYRYCLLEAGHIAQNLYLVSDALGLATCAVGAFFDDKLSSLLGISRDETPVYILPVGIPKI